MHYSPLIFLFFILVTFAAAEQNAQLELVKGETKAFAGRQIQLIGTGPSYVIITVDGTYGKVPISKEETMISGVYVTLDYFREESRYSNATASIKLRTPAVCGDGKCEKIESEETCCIDCSCGGNTSTCYQNRCIPESFNQCSVDGDCDDLLPCTLNTCSGIPKACVFTSITSCAGNDSCCPEGCNATSDNDCDASLSCASEDGCNAAVSADDTGCAAFGNCSAADISQADVADVSSPDRADAAVFRASWLAVSLLIAEFGLLGRVLSWKKK